MVRTVSVLSGIGDIRTMSGTGKGSIPHRREGHYLRLYMLQKENERLGQEYASVEKRRLSLKRRLKENGNESARLERQNNAEEGSAALTTPRRSRRTRASTRPIRHQVGAGRTGQTGQTTTERMKS